MRPGERGTAAEQRANLREACAALRPLLGGELVVTHGNGPQVGNELLRQERAADEVPPLPLYLAVAQTQAEIGALIESELEPVAGRPVACLLTHVLVAEDDPAFAEPTKPVGPFYGEEQARALERDRGWQVVHDAGRGWRRVVPSPQPLEVVELERDPLAARLRHDRRRLRRRRHPGDAARRAPRRHRRRDRQGPRLLPAGPRARRRPARDPHRGRRRLLGLRHRRARRSCASSRSRRGRGAPARARGRLDAAEGRGVASSSSARPATRR